MKKGIGYRMIFFIALVFIACSHAKNYKEAYAIKLSGKNYIELLGERKFMVHNLGDIFSNKTYRDSILIPVPSFQNATINGKDIPLKRGYYNYFGSIKIENGKLIVNLLINNTDDKKLEPLSWNGTYNLIIK